MASSSTKTKKGGEDGKTKDGEKKEVWAPTRGATVWITDDSEESFVKSLVYKVEDDVVDIEGGQRPISEVFPVNPESQDGVPDNTMMDHLYDPNLLHNLSVRYGKDEIYTYIAYILIAINPYKQLPVYSEDLMWAYRKGTMGSLPPHVFAIAERAFRHMRGGKRSQSIICSGDSGAGKTETCKYLLRYMTTVAGSHGESGSDVLEKRIIEANPIIEAFGNAKTLRNNNSSRFGKFVRVHFSEDNKVVGADITTYLLEKSRLVVQSKKERNFHVFYQLLAGAGGDLRKTLGLGSKTANDFRYTNQGACVTIDGVDDGEGFNHVSQAMTLAGLSDAERTGIFSVLAALLFLGDIEFEDAEIDNAEGSEISENSNDVVEKFCAIAQCHREVVKKALAQRTMTIVQGKDTNVFQIPLKKDEAEFARDTLAKQIYGRLFDYIVKAINDGMPLEGESQHFIGILDISGFEYFDNNGFEQFLINYCNEKIQQYFIQQIMHQEQQIYQQEGLRWKTVQFNDNFKCLELIEKKSHGVLALLQEQCILPKGSDERFTSNLTRVMVTNEKLMLCGKVPKKMQVPGLGNRRFMNEEAFIIRHFAADVCYQTRGWLAKNNDAIHGDLLNMIQDSKEKTLSNLFAEDLSNVDDDDKVGRPEKANKSTRYATISTKFTTDLESLMKTLSETQSHFIRCINPNLKMQPGLIGRSGVITQLRCSGMLEALQIMQAGFPTRCLFTDLHMRYKHLVPAEVAALHPKLFSEALLVALDLEGGIDFQMGLSRVFFRAGKAAMMDDLINGNPQMMEQVAAKIRKWLAKKRWRQYIFAVISIGRLGKLIEDIREEHRRIEEERRMKSEEYQAELRRKREEEERLLREELKRQEEEERKRKEEEERRRQEKLAKKLAREKELARLRDEAQQKLDLESRLEQEQTAFHDMETELREEIEALEQELEKAQDHRAQLEKELAESRSKERALEEINNFAQDEIDKLREYINQLEDELMMFKAKLVREEEFHKNEKEGRKQDNIAWKNKYDEMVEMKNEEIERIKDESAQEIDRLKREMEELLAEMKRQAELDMARLQEEKEESLARLEAMAEEQLMVMERSTAKPTKSGYLWKKGGGLNPWKKLFFVLKSNYLTMYKDNSDTTVPIGVIDIEHCRVYKSAPSKKKKDAKFDGCEFEVASKDKTTLIRCDYARDVDQWIQAITMAKARHMASTTINLDKVSVSAVKQGLVGRNMHIVRDEKTTETSTRDGNGDIVERARATVSMRSPRD